MTGNILDQNQSFKFHMISIALSVILCALGGVVFKSQYDKFKAEQSFELVAYLTICVLAVLFGTILIMLNFKDKYKPYFLMLICGVMVASVVLSPAFRLGIILLILAMVSFLLCMRFKNVFSTFITLGLSAILFLIITVIVLVLYPGINENLLIYSMLSVFLLSYRVYGTRANQWFIANLGFKKESLKYNDKQLTNQFSFVYLIVYIVLNVFLYLGKTDDTTWNLVNNSFLTGMAIFQVDWKNIVFYYREKTENK